jgi:hypothetical protein
VDDGARIREAWQTTWRHPYVWILGLFAGGAVGVASGGGASSSFMAPPAYPRPAPRGPIRATAPRPGKAFIVDPHNLARRAVHKAIAGRRLPHLLDLCCAVCGATATEYHHPRGYAPEHWLDVVALCHRSHMEAHHTFYASPVAATPDWAIHTLCGRRHATAHGR